MPTNVDAQGEPAAIGERQTRMGIARSAALGCTLLLLSACGPQDATPPATTKAPERSTTSAAPPVSIRAGRGCGPDDGPIVDVVVTGAPPTDLQAELVVDGTVVATSDPAVVEQSGALWIEVPYVPEMFDPLTVMSIHGGSVRVRPVEGGEVLAEDDTISPMPPSGGCG